MIVEPYIHTRLDFDSWQVEKIPLSHVNALGERYVVRCGSMTGTGRTLKEAYEAWGANYFEKHRSEFNEGTEWLPSECDAPRGCICLTCASERADTIIKQHAEKLGLPTERLGIPDGEFERTYYTKQEVDDRLKHLVEEFDKKLPGATVGRMLDTLQENGVALDRLVIQIDGQLIRVREQGLGERYLTEAEIDRRLHDAIQAVVDYVDQPKPKKPRKKK